MEVFLSKRFSNNNFVSIFFSLDFHHVLTRFSKRASGPGFDQTGFDLTGFDLAEFRPEFIEVRLRFGGVLVEFRFVSQPFFRRDVLRGFQGDCGVISG